MKVKVLALLCFVGTLCFSCDDDDDKVTEELKVGEMSIAKASAGEEVSITGEGFSEVTEENIVKIGELVVEVKEATKTQLKIVIPENAETGNLTVTVGEQIIDFGEIKILKETIFALKTNYLKSEDYIVTVDPKSGKETIFMQLPKVDHKNSEMIYSSLNYLSSREEIVVARRPEWPVNECTILGINIHTKELKEIAYPIEVEFEDIELITDGKEKVYIAEVPDWGSEEQTKLYEFNLENKTKDLFVEVATSTYYYKINSDVTKFYFLEEGKFEDDYQNKLKSLNIETKAIEEIVLNYNNSLSTIVGFSNGNLLLTADFKTKDDTYVSEIVAVNLEDKSVNVVGNLPEEEIWYGNGVFSSVSNSILFFVEIDEDYTSKIIKADLNTKEPIEMDYTDTDCYVKDPIMIVM